MDPIEYLSQVPATGPFYMVLIENPSKSEHIQVLVFDMPGAHDELIKWAKAYENPPGASWRAYCVSTLSLSNTRPPPTKE